MESFIQENGKEVIVMDMEFRYGPMVQNIKGFGKTGKLMVKENLFTSMETFTTVNGKMIKLVDMASISTIMVLATKATGLTTISTVLASRLGLTEANMKAVINRVKNMAKENMYGEMAVIIKAVGKTIK